MNHMNWEVEFLTKHIPGWELGCKDGVEFIHSEEQAMAVERGWAQFVAYVRDNEHMYPNGFHHMGMHWTDIYSVLPKEQYKPGILRVAHRKLGTKNIHCLRKERLPNDRIRWVLSFHWEGKCPACKRVTLALGKIPKPAKLLLPNRVETTDNGLEKAEVKPTQLLLTPKTVTPNDNGRPKLMLRKTTEKIEPE